MNQVLKMTLLDEIKKVAEKGEFQPTDELPPVEDGALVVGECVPLEKAVFTLYHNKGKEFETLMNSLEESEGENFANKKARLLQLKEQVKLLKDIFWQLIKDRLDKHQHNLSVCQDLKIVEHPQDEENQSGHVVSSIRIIEVGGSGLARILGLG